MDLKDIEKIMKLMEDHGLHQFKLEQEDTKLELKKGGDVDMEAIGKFMASQQPAQMMPYPQQPAGPAPSGPAAAEPAGDGLPPGTEEIPSPMVGTFYLAEKPEADPFVKVGDKVEADTTICVIEAMKVFNPIQADTTGEIVKVLVENGTAVQYGEPLFLVKK